MLNWIDYRKALFGRIGEFARLSPDTVKAYQAMTNAGQKADLLGAKMRELISLAVAVSLRCDGCITVHTAEALKHGATREEIAEALGVAVAMNDVAKAQVASHRFGEHQRVERKRQPVVLGESVG